MVPNHDRLFKIRPILDSLNQNFPKILIKQCLAIDEQMCSTKAQCYLKQHLPDKHSKSGYKIFVLADSDAFTHQFELYSAEENQKRLDSEPNLGASANIVIRLMRCVLTN
jgi:hypothetical protein